jgi:ketosteroid isomerase-like protein
MNRLLFALCLAALVFTGCAPTDVTETASAVTYPETPSDLDAYWAEASRTVAEGDFEGYAATYHEDAVFVGAINGETYPISEALAGWKPGFDDTAAGKQQSNVEFRFSQRLSDPTTAHDTGIFHYTAVDSTGVESGYYIHFEGLLTMKNGWKMMMEYQKSVATLEEWDALQ